MVCSLPLTNSTTQAYLKSTCPHLPQNILTHNFSTSDTSSHTSVGGPTTVL